LEAGLLDEVVRREIERAETEHVTQNRALIRFRLGERAILNLNVKALITKLWRQWQLAIQKDAAAAAVANLMSRSRPADESRQLPPLQETEPRQL
jgi:hypothetical protein